MMKMIRNGGDLWSDLKCRNLMLKWRIGEVKLNIKVKNMSKFFLVFFPF